MAVLGNAVVGQPMDAVPPPGAPCAGPVPSPSPSPASNAEPSFLRLHRWQALAALIGLIGGG
jgi:hypothetical protein